MDSLVEHSINCPYCGEIIAVLVDPGDAGSQYIEDCQVCCRPIIFNLVTTIDGELSLSVHDENESF